MKIALTGYEGTVGKEIQRQMGVYPLLADVMDKDQVAWEVDRVKPDVIIHCAAMTNVHECENHSRDAFEVNVRGTYNILDSFHGPLIYLSTDHVFNGNAYYTYGERHKPDPPNVYGMTKWMAEETIKLMHSGKFIIVRTSKLFSLDEMSSDLYRLKDEESVEFTNLIFRSFLHVQHFVAGLKVIVRNCENMPNLIHLAGSDRYSYYNFWQMVARMFEIDVDLVTPRNERIEDDPRPFRAGLDVSKAKKLKIPIYSAVDGVAMVKTRVVWK